MKHLLLAVVLLINTSYSEAQKIRFTDTTNRWRLLSVNTEQYSHTKVDKLGKDTVISGHTYYPITTLLGSGYVREDTIAQKLFFRIGANTGGPQAHDTFEHVFFDYNLHRNDTFLLTEGTYQWRHYVQAIDSVLMGGYYYKVWHMQRFTTTFPMSNPSYTFIEGIGSNYGPGLNTFPVTFEECSQLRCFTNKGMTLPCSPHISLPCANAAVPPLIGPLPVYWFDNDSSCNLSLKIQDVAATVQPILYPNPAMRQTVLKIPSNIRQATVVITDMIGAVVVQQEVRGGTEFAIGHYIEKPGVYHYSLQNKLTGEKFTGQFARQ